MSNDAAIIAAYTAAYTAFSSAAVTLRKEKASQEQIEAAERGAIEAMRQLDTYKTRSG